MTTAPRNRRARAQALLLAVLMALPLLSAGCLFPPVETTDAGTAQFPFSGTGSPAYRMLSKHMTLNGTLPGPGLRVSDQNVGGAEDRRDDIWMPPRLDGLRLNLTWERGDGNPEGTDDLNELHLAASLYLNGTGQIIWGRSADDADSIEIASKDEDELSNKTAESPSTLVVQIHAESSTGTIDWVLEIQYRYEVARETGPA